MRKIAIAVAVILAVVIVALLVVPHFVNVNNYRGQIQAELQKRLGRPVTLGNMRLCCCLQPSLWIARPSQKTRVSVRSRLRPCRNWR
jgi:uncharacterized protein involved in outer membrane biogenesis